jgi:protein-S-isoprenylcysteine O-methyltransferase Ste14
VVFGWQGWGEMLRMLLLLFALVLFWSGAKRYDLRFFLGFDQLASGKATVLLSSSENFSATGIFSLTRHPWYLGSLLFLWSIFPEYSRSVFMAVLILSLYLIVGTFLEERKIVREHGDSYRRYQQQVSMLFPWKWLKARLKR